MIKKRRLCKAIYLTGKNLKKNGRKLISLDFLPEDLNLLLRKNKNVSKAKWPDGQGERQMTFIGWSWLLQNGDDNIKTDILDAINGDSMSLSRAGLKALNLIECPERNIAMEIFYERWKNYPVILDAWFGLEASIPRLDALHKINLLFKHSKFDSKAPNTIRAILSGLSQNIDIFHSQDGTGYNFMAEKLIDLDKRNPITASRIVKVFSQWKKYISPLSENMYKSILKISESELSRNTKEVVDLIKG